ncbi:MAG: glycoside hydrolase family 3 [Lachnospiraceae bacterium]|nr:glycoside hydrolase family 3 [Lachnospiraceae bacterium]
MRRIPHTVLTLLLAALLLLAGCGKKQDPTLPTVPGGLPEASTAAGQTTAAPTISPDAPTTAVPVTTTASSPTDSVPATASVPSTAAPTSETAPTTTTRYIVTDYPTSGDPSASDPDVTAQPTEPASTEDPSLLSLRERAAAYLAQMDTRTRLFQLMIVAPEAICLENPATTPDGLKLSAYPVSGLVYQAQNMENAEQLTALVEGHQKASVLPLFICVEEEGGRASCLIRTIGTTPVKNMFTYRGDGIEKARTNALTLATDIRQYGFNLDLAPVADVWTEPENKVIGERAYGDDFAKTAALIAAAVKGFHEGGVICTLKHFPGYGAAAPETEGGIPAVNKTPDQLREEEFLPFLAGIEAGADLVMTAYLSVPEADPLEPAVFSRRIVTDLLRNGLAFDGVIITDNLADAAAASSLSAGEACLKALNAGCDLLFCPAGDPETLGACADYLAEALQAGRLSAARVDESLLRILMLKIKYGILP